MAHRSSGLRLGLWVALGASLAAAPASAAELLILDDDFTFATPCAGDCGLFDGTAHGFYEVPPPAGPPSDWTSPDNYRAGVWYVRFEVRSQATSRASRMQVCIWQSDSDETCSPLVRLDGPGSVVTASSSPTSWWMGGTVDFTNPGAFQGIGSPLWSDGQPCSDGNAAHVAICDWGGTDCCWDDRDDYFPMTVRMTVVAVAQGSTFSGWDTYVTPVAKDAGVDAPEGSPTDSAGSQPDGVSSADGATADGATADGASSERPVGGGCSCSTRGPGSDLPGLLVGALLALGGLPGRGRRKER
jgi:MYXO-CTERM domain-containing protein